MAVFKLKYVLFDSEPSEVEEEEETKPMLR